MLHFIVFPPFYLIILNKIWSGKSSNFIHRCKITMGQTRDCKINSFLVTSLHLGSKMSVYAVYNSVYVYTVKVCIYCKSTVYSVSKQAWIQSEYKRGTLLITKQKCQINKTYTYTFITLSLFYFTCNKN